MTGATVPLLGLSPIPFGGIIEWNSFVVGTIPMAKPLKFEHGHLCIPCANKPIWTNMAVWTCRIYLLYKLDCWYWLIIIFTIQTAMNRISHFVRQAMETHGNTQFLRCLRPEKRQQNHKFEVIYCGWNKHVILFLKAICSTFRLV